jgi:hypothetical protein
MFARKRTQKKLCLFVESNEYAIKQKAEIIVEHFPADVISKGKVGGKARAMVVTIGIQRAIEYFYAIGECLKARKSPYKAIVAYYGEKNVGRLSVKESDINGFPSTQIEKKFKADPYRISSGASGLWSCILRMHPATSLTLYLTPVRRIIMGLRSRSRFSNCRPHVATTSQKEFWKQ